MSVNSFKEVLPKSSFIKNMFNHIALTYDLLNNVLSLGTHHLWKKKLVHEAIKERPLKILDCATGTGDIAMSMKTLSPKSSVVGIDFSAEMLKSARKKQVAKKLDIDFQEQDILSLSYEDNAFDVCTISYGIRNVENTTLALQEMARVTSKKLLILEFGRPKNVFFKGLYFGLMNVIIPGIGRLFQQKKAYQYLIDSSKAFPCAEDFVKLIKNHTQFKDVRYRPIFGGITYLYTAQQKQNAGPSLMTES